MGEKKQTEHKMSFCYVLARRCLKSQYSCPAGRHLSVSACHHNPGSPSPPPQELKITFSSSSGPGGQNVNKLATKVDLRFHIGNSNWLSSEEKEIVLEKLSNYITKD